MSFFLCEETHISLDLPEAIYTRKVKLKNSGKVEKSAESVEFGLKWKLNLFMSQFDTLQYPGEFSFLVTANQIEPCVTGAMEFQRG